LYSAPELETGSETSDIEAATGSGECAGAAVEAEVGVGTRYDFSHSGQRTILPAAVRGNVITLGQCGQPTSIQFTVGRLAL
jgi:hypothetical protein